MDFHLNNVLVCRLPHHHHCLIASTLLVRLYPANCSRERWCCRQRAAEWGTRLNFQSWCEWVISVITKPPHRISTSSYRGCSVVDYHTTRKLINNRVKVKQEIVPWMPWKCSGYVHTANVRCPVSFHYCSKSIWNKLTIGADWVSVYQRTRSPQEQYSIVLSSSSSKCI
jgi:hypothetical protein